MKTLQTVSLTLSLSLFISLALTACNQSSEQMTQEQAKPTIVKTTAENNTTSKDNLSSNIAPLVNVSLDNPSSV